jgi:hypothetical protein
VIPTALAKFVVIPITALAKEPNILREMDSVGHKLSLEGIEVLRQVQKKNMPFESQTILPSKSSISRISKIVEQYGMVHAFPGGSE